MTRKRAYPGKMRRAGAGPIRILISSCLLGEKVRYDGGNKRDPFLVDTLGRFVEYVPVCPEVECGLSIPREAMRLEGDPAAPRLVTVKTGVDHTERMISWAGRKLRELEKVDLCGYICKKDSPSSGLGPVAGLFTKAFMDRFPAIPVEDEAGLRDRARREKFLERVLGVRRLREARRKAAPDRRYWRARGKTPAGTLARVRVSGGLYSEHPAVSASGPAGHSCEEVRS